MTPQQEAELAFWRKELEDPDYMNRRYRDYCDNLRWLPEIATQQGRGVDIGCGPTSMFEGLNFDVVCVDPLAVEYQQISLPDTALAYEPFDAEDLPFEDESFDWAWCMNVIDHTPNPDRLLSEMFRILKPGGFFYFGVFYDTALYAPHYDVWDGDRVELELGDRKLLRGVTEWWDEQSKYRYWGLYRK